MAESVSYNAYEAFRPHFDALARVGYHKLIPESKSSWKNNLHYAYRVAVWVIIITYNLQHIIKAVLERHSTDRIVNTLFILLTTINTMMKQLAFNIRSRRIDKVIGVISGPVFAPQNLYHEEVMRANAVEMHRLLLFYISGIFVCGSLWTIFPLVNNALGQDVDFTAYFPFDTKRSPAFYLVDAYMNIFITFQAYGNVTMDCTIVNFYAQAKVQLKILRYNLQHLADKDENGGAKFMKQDYTGYKDVDDENFNRALQKKFTQCVVRYLEIKRFIPEIESIFAEALTFQIFVTAWVICMTVYKIVGLNLLSAEFLSMAMYLCCILGQLFIYCYYGTQVKTESEFIIQSAFQADWISLSVSFRRQLIILMENCKRPIIPRTAYVIPISLETYIAVIRASYTLFTFLDRK
ncbi:hypothetical protein O0L34_g14328 [Tuta absoluta]|nr:hypothetical protein O0L34_g14328 [Tuta absoluta]